MHIPFIDGLLRYLYGDGLTVLPQMELLLFALGILIFDFLLGRKEKYMNAGLAFLGVVASGVGIWKQYQQLSGRIAAGGEHGLFGFNNSVAVDSFALFFSVLFLCATALVILLSARYMEIEQEQEGEYYALLLLACIGMMFMATGIDLIVVFLGLETMALSFYVLTGFLRRDKRSNEAAMKYLLLGAFSTGILLYGFSLLYGVTGSTNMAVIGQLLQRRLEITLGGGMADWFSVLAFVTIAAGMFFKLAAVPFHQWAPDVYEGAPTPIAAYVSVASKTASFAMFLRLMLIVFGATHQLWMYAIAGVAIASLAWGNLAALTQTNVKRMLAYSSISHVGYILLGLVAGNNLGLVGIAYYLLAYLFMTVGAFAVLIILRHKGVIGDELDDLDGLYYRNPTAAVLLLIFMLSLAGIPPTAGFMGKYFIFQALINSHHPALALAAALFIVPGLYYYIRVVVHAWLKGPREEAGIPHMTSAQAVALGVALFVSLAAGLYPEPFTRLAHYAFGL